MVAHRHPCSNEGAAFNRGQKEFYCLACVQVMLPGASSALGLVWLLINKRMCWGFVDRFAGSYHLFDYLSIPELDCSVGIAAVGGIVCDHDDGLASSIQFSEQSHDLVAGF